MKSIQGKTALVTGATGGIGREIARTLAERGMNLVLTSRSPSALENVAEAARTRGVAASCLTADLRERDDIERLAEEAETASDGIAVLVNNAAIESALPYEQVDVETIEEMIAVNLTAPMMLTRLLLPHMIRRGGGHIVNISSLAGLVGTPYEEAYAATKHGLVGFSRSLRLTLAAEEHPVGVSVICPAFVEDAGMYHEARTASGAEAPAMIGTVPMSKLGSAVVQAITRDQPEVVLTGKPIRPFLVTQALSPQTADRMSALIGVPAMFRAWADASLRSNDEAEI